MKKDCLFFLKNTSLAKRVLAIVLCVIVLVTSLITTGIVLAAESDFEPIEHYFPLKGSSSNNDFYKDSNWSFEGRDFTSQSEKPAFETSDKNYEAPLVEIKDGGTKADLKWDSIDGAQKYILKLFCGNQLVQEKNLTETYCTIDNLQKNTRYAVQVTVFSDKLIAASKIREFYTYDEASVITTLLDGLSTDGTDKFSGIKTEPSTSKDVLYVNDVNAKNLMTILTKTTADRFDMPEKVEGFVFRFSQENLDTDNEKWLSPDFKLYWKYNDTIKSVNAGVDTKVYFIEDDGNVYTINRGKYGYQTYRNNDTMKFKNGLVVIPADIYKDGETLLSGRKDIYFEILVNDFSEISYNSTENKYIETKLVKAGNRNLYFSNFAAISDLDSFLEGNTNLTSTYEFKKAGIYSCDSINDEEKTLKNDEYATGYSYIPTGLSTGLTYTLRDTGNSFYGMSLKFTAPKSGEYDINSEIKVVSNNKEADINYRVLKIGSNGNEEKIYPISDDFAVLQATNSNINPISDFDLTTVKLSEGDSLRFEAYADIKSGSGSVDIKLSGPNLTIKSPQNTSKGKVYTYSALDYAQRFQYDKQDTTVDFVSNAENRWTISGMDIENNYASLPFTYFNGTWESMTYAKRGNARYGYYALINDKQIRTQTDRYNGLRIDFKATKEGIAVITTGNKPDGISPVESKLRIVKNDCEQIFPKSGWYTGVETVSVNCNVENGDTISIQQYTEIEEANSSTMVKLGIPTVKIYEINTSNLAGDGYYSALWDRPYKSTDYEGGFEQSENVWSFDAYKNSVLIGDKVISNSNGIKVYNEQIGDNSYYRFTDKELIYRIVENNTGFSLGFTAPQSGYYDFGAALAIQNDEGELAWRISKDNVSIYPESNWNTLTDKTFVQKEFYLKSGETIRLEGFAKSIKGESLNVLLGSPVVVPVRDFMPTPNGKAYIYNAYNYIDFERGYTGAYILNSPVFEYKLIDINNNESENGVGYKKDSTLKVTLPNGYSSKISYTPVREGSCSVTALITADTALNVRVLKNGNEIYNETNTSHNLSLFDTLKLSDELEIISSGAQNITFEQPLCVAVDTAYTNQNESDSEIFIASLASPYSDDKYTGEWNSYDRIWNFKQFTVDEDEITKIRHLNFYDNGHLYHTDNDIGYYFKENKLFGDLKTIGDNKIGLLLEFTAPYEEDFDFISGLTLESANNTRLVVKILKGNECIWTVTEDVTEGQSINVPIRYLELAKGEKIALQVYADEISNETQAKISFGAPIARKHTAFEVNSNDISVNVYRPTDYIPYNGVYYSGKYYPMENSWNYSFINLTDEMSNFDGDSFNYGKIISTNNESINYSFSGTNVIAPSLFTTDSSGNTQKVVGSDITFITPADGEYLINTNLKLNSPLETEQKAYFRILVNDKKIYPENADWEVLEGDETSLELSQISTALKQYDVIRFQIYSDSLQEGSNLKKKLNFTLTPYVARILYKNENKNTYSFKTDMTKYYQFSPYWSLDYTENISEPSWKRMERYHSSWGFYLANMNYIGATVTYNQIWFKNNEFGTNTTPGAAISHYVPKDGYITISKNMMFLRDGEKELDLPSAKVRITQNGNKVWPESDDWITLSATKAGYKNYITDLQLKVEKGDIIRFEFTPEKQLTIADDNIYVSLNPNFSFSKYKQVYSSDDDIYGMLDEETYKYFKNKQSEQFDVAASSKLQASQDFLERIEWLSNIWLNKIGNFVDDLVGDDMLVGDKNNIVDDTNVPVDDTNDPGGTIRRKKVVTIITQGLDVWIIIVIVVAVVSILGIGLIIYIKKQKTKGKV